MSEDSVVRTTLKTEKGIQVITERGFLGAFYQAVDSKQRPVSIFTADSIKRPSLEVHHKLSPSPYILTLLDTCEYLHSGRSMIIAITDPVEASLDEELDRRRKEGRKISEIEAVEMLRDMLQGLLYMQEMGFAHMRVSPLAMFLGRNATGTITVKIGKLWDCVELSTPELDKIHTDVLSFANIINRVVYASEGSPKLLHICQRIMSISKKLTFIDVKLDFDQSFPDQYGGNRSHYQRDSSKVAPLSTRQRY